MTMFSYLKSLFVSLNQTGKKPPEEEYTPEKELICRLKPYESYLYKMQNIISWKNFHLSAFSVALVNVIFWFFSYYEWRFIGFFFTFLAAYLFHDAWVNYIWPEIRVKKPDEPRGEKSVRSPQKEEGVLTLPELSKYATEIQSIIVKRYEWMKHLRSSQPALFCAVSSGWCLVLVGFGSVFSGIALLYMASMALLTLPGAYIHLVTPQQKESCSQILRSIYCFILPPDSSKDVDEYMPDTSQENLDILSKAGNNSNDLSTPSSESSMVDLIPCHDESSLDTVDSFMLPAGGVDGSETDSEGDALSFKNTHFNGNSSGEDDVSLVKDLAFPEVTAAQSGGISSTLTGVFYKTFPSLSGRLQFRAAGEEVVPSPAEEGDSDSEFEIIDKES